MRFATTFLFLLLVVPGAAIGATGWSCSADTAVAVVAAGGNQWNVQMAPDGAHGAVMVWQDRRDGTTDKLYVQRVGWDGRMLWAEGGIPLANTPGYQYYPQILGDGAGGAFVVWQDNRHGTDYDIYLQHISADGEMLLAEDGVGLCKSTGHQYYPKIVPGQAGELLVVWQDKRAGNFDIYAQKLNRFGDLLWTPNGILVCNTAFDQVNPVVTSDGAGGAIVAWSDFRGSTGFTDIYAQRIRWNGGAGWPANGVPIATATNNQWNPQIVSDGVSGALIGWQDRRNSFYDLVYMQRVDSTGAARWTANGTPVAAAEGNQYYPKLVPDGQGGAVSVWQDNRNGSSYDVYAQRTGSGGQSLWPAAGKAVCTAVDHQYYPQIVQDGGSVVIAWQDRRGGTFDVYAQRIDLAGNTRWDQNGVAIAASASDQYIPQIAGDGFEGAVLGWSDFKLGTGSTDIFAHRIGSNGLLAGGCFRTFDQDSLSKRGLRIRKSLSMMPNEGNIRDSIFARGVFSQGMVVGVERPDSAKRYGWIYYRKSYYVRRTLPQIGEARGFDRRFDKPFVGMLRNPSLYRYNNSVVGELVALKLNIAASEVGITPPYFGDLRYQDPDNPVDPLNGLDLRGITRRVDSMLTYWRSFPGLDYNRLYSSLRRINRAFDGPLDTLALRPLRITPAECVFAHDFLIPNTAPPEQVPLYAPLEGVPEEEQGFRLEQNYPNPFNPTTTIEFNLPAPSAVTLSIYDLTGRLVASLYDNTLLEEGFQAVDFDAGGLSTGIYFYRINAIPRESGGKPLSFVRKMVLVK